MNNPHILVDVNEASSELIKFIGTEKFNEVLSAIENNAKSGFMAGLSFAICLMMANCKTYLYHIEEQGKVGESGNGQGEGYQRY